MKRTIRDSDGDPAIVTTWTYTRWVGLRLTAFVGSVAHLYTPAQARKLAAALVEAADKVRARQANVKGVR